MLSPRLVLTAVALLAMLTMPGVAAGKKSVWEAGLDRCISKYAACLRVCDRAPNTTKQIYESCNTRCDTRFNACYRKVLEAGREIGGQSTRNESLFETQSLGTSGEGGGGTGDQGGSSGGAGPVFSTGNAGMSSSGGSGVIY